MKARAAPGPALRACARRARGVRLEVARAQLTLALRRAQRRRAVDDDLPLLVVPVEVVRPQLPPLLDLVQRAADLLAAERLAYGDAAVVVLLQLRVTQIQSS